MPEKSATPPTEYVPDCAEMKRPERENEHPLGPMVEIVELDHPLWGRLYAAVMLAGAVALLAVAFSLKPDKHHMGTHRQLGLPPCGFVAMTGFPCPTCGMTTAFAHTIRGQWGAALYAQPAGMALALGTVLLMIFSLLATITGRRPSLNWYRLDPVRLVWGGALVLVLSWGFKAFAGVLDGTLPVTNPF